VRIPVCLLPIPLNDVRTLESSGFLAFLQRSDSYVKLRSPHNAWHTLHDAPQAYDIHSYNSNILHWLNSKFLDGSDVPLLDEKEKARQVAMAHDLFWDDFLRFVIGQTPRSPKTEFEEWRVLVGLDNLDKWREVNHDFIIHFFYTISEQTRDNETGFMFFHDMRLFSLVTCHMPKTRDPLLYEIFLPK
jgi:hypothetical protein